MTSTCTSSSHPVAPYLEFKVDISIHATNAIPCDPITSVLIDTVVNIQIFFQVEVI